MQIEERCAGHQQPVDLLDADRRHDADAGRSRIARMSQTTVRSRVSDTPMVIC